ncbi:uncharacterized protein TRIADDRAFT_25080 [Trichoplax adhaerens]|uniref:RRM domain-containing protein n=1 Tax=Trichoplax adhaerens TaxID=10228 RepID=B3RWX1_TRIAD|nr:hypothetical protein TRIADDRAFT_25080 [Trichoplax adhaerens]EDV24770.1 hypothetical protein TRIADDRAFT_25080 [Trichoplax adhaerens]|eukprot:XP_002112660.1 hypothetical protein TRIADDRAFT_25080 [Trichoplax adhaerens]
MNSGDALPYVAVSHVRDILIPPIQRQRKRKLWNEAANYVSKNDSRVRLETQRIAGEDFEVWRWTCQSSPALNHKFKSLYSSLPIEKNSEIEQLVVPGIGFKVWQGQIKHTNNIISRTIECNDSCCLKLGNMFDYELESGSDWTSRIQDAILEKCGDSSSIVHIHVERYSNRGSVYIKCSQIEDAKETFKAMHGCIFDGRIVRARFISNQTYHSLFPDAAKFSEPLKPSNDSVRSMIFLAEANIYLS